MSLPALVAPCVQIAYQWERAVLLRFGKFVGIRGSGLFVVLPVIDKVAQYVDQRIRVSDFRAETTLTKDTVPVNVDAIALRQSRIILGTAETEIAQKFAKASESYRQNPVALHLRAMNMVYEGLKQKGSMIIVPSTAVETMGLGALGGLTSFAGPPERNVAAKEAPAAELPGAPGEIG